MSVSAQWKVHLLVGLFALVTELAWATIAPLYETGASVVVSPFLCLLSALFLLFYLLRRHWAYRWSPYYAAATGVVMASFLGESVEFYGKYASAMAVVEICVLASSVGLLGVYFLPGIKTHFAQVQPNNSLERTREG